jgi:dienelactone hydrolase
MRMDRTDKFVSYTVIIIFVVIGVLSPLYAQEETRCEWLEKPVDDSTFKTYLEFFIYEKDLPFDLEIIETCEKEGIRKEHLSFQSTRGERVYVNFYSATGSNSEKQPAIILLHGGTPLGKDSPYLNVLAERTARAGWRVLAIDMKYYGERKTDLMKTFSLEEKRENLYNNPPVYRDWVIQTVKDVSRSFDFLVQNKDADAEKISLMGISRGAVVGTIAGAVEKRLMAIMLFHGGHSSRGTKHMPIACPANYIGRISPRPLLMMNGTKDIIFEKNSAILPLYNLANKPKKIIWIEGGHGATSDEASTEVRKWMQKYAR